MKKIRLLQVAFLAVAVIACIPLTIEVFGAMNPDIIQGSAIFAGIGLPGNCICAIIRADNEWKKK